MVTRLNRRALYPYLLLGPSPSKRADAIAGGAKIEKRDSYRVERFVMSASEILDGPEYWPGNTIIPFLGERGDDRPTGRAPRYHPRLGSVRVSNHQMSQQLPRLS
jgi:hypothetical protein